MTRPSGRRPSLLTAPVIDRLCAGLLAGWIGGVGWMIARDQIAMWPPRPPTPAEVAAATPRARRDWVAVYAALSARLADPPPEVGEVWAARSGRICGYVDAREAAVDRMTRFFTVHGRPVLQDEDEALYRRVWTGCIDSRWVELHAGSEKTGFCATGRGRRSVIGRRLCAGWTP